MKTITEATAFRIIAVDAAGKHLAHSEALTERLLAGCANAEYVRLSALAHARAAEVLLDAADAEGHARGASVRAEIVRVVANEDGSFTLVRGSTWIADYASRGAAEAGLATELRRVAGR